MSIQQIYARVEKLNNSDLEMLAKMISSLYTRRVSMYEDYGTMLLHWRNMTKGSFKYDSIKDKDWFLVTLLVTTNKGKNYFFQKRVKTRLEVKQARKDVAKLAYEQVIDDINDEENDSLPFTGTIEELDIELDKIACNIKQTYKKT